MARAVQAVLVLTMLAASSASGRTWYVTDDGLGDAPTLQAAADSSSPGDSILVGPGVYEERVSLGSKSDLVLRGEFGAAATTIDAGGAPGTNTLTAVRSSTIEGLRLTGAVASGYGWLGGGAAVSGWGSLVIRDCELESGIEVEGELELLDSYIHSVTGIGLNYAAIVFGGENLRIEGCTFEGNREVVLQIWWRQFPGAATTAMIRSNVFLSNGTIPNEDYSVIGYEPEYNQWEPESLDMRVEGNLFVDNACNVAGPVSVGVTGPRRLRHPSSYAVAIVGNTIARSRGYSLGGPGGLPPGARVERNVVTGSPWGLVLDENWETQVIACNLSWGNGQNWAGFPEPTGINGNLSEPPKYCDADAGDFTVAENSPCLPANNSCGVQIGAFGEGCGPISVEPQSWARIKAAYR